MKTRQCRLCNTEKELNKTNFHPRTDGRSGGFKTECRDCANARRRAKYTPKPKPPKRTHEEILEYQRRYRQESKERIAKQRKQFREDNKERLQAEKREYYRANREKILEQRKTEESKAKRRVRRPKYRQRETDYQRRKRHADPSFNLRCRIGSAVANTMANRGVSKTGSVWTALPYTPEQLKEHLQAQFDEHMTWENYGEYWHIDHIHPQSLLPYDSLEHPNFQKCWALENLQPLEAIENIKKSNKIL